MKKQKPIKLTSGDLPVQVIGIVSKSGGHRISWLINSILNISLSLSYDKKDNESSDATDNINNKDNKNKNEENTLKLYDNNNNNKTSPYSVYFVQTAGEYYKLLSNKNPETVLFKKYKNINYLFFAIGEKVNLKNLKEKLKTENDIIAVFDIDVEEFTQKFLKQFIF